jgi:hypothetical protein
VFKVDTGILSSCVTRAPVISGAEALELDGFIILKCGDDIVCIVSAFRLSNNVMKARLRLSLSLAPLT